MTITHYNIKPQQTCFQGTETQSNSQSPKCLQNWVSRLLKSGQHTILSLKQSSGVFSEANGECPQKALEACTRCPSHRGPAEAPKSKPTVSHRAKGNLPPMGTPWMGTLPSTKMCAGPHPTSAQVSPTVLAWPLWGSTPRWLPVNQHHLCKSPCWSPQKHCSNSLCQGRMTYSVAKF